MTIVIFGGAGDLAHRKLLPALYNLHVDRLLPTPFAVVGVGRRDFQDDGYRDFARSGVAEFSRRSLDESEWSEFARQLFFVNGAFEDPNTFAALGSRLDIIEHEGGLSGERVYYLAVPPSMFVPIVEQLARARFVRSGASKSAEQPAARLIVEKPIGFDLASARTINDAIAGVFAERDTYRIDHYLGKETVQNILVLRFANNLYEPLFNHRYVDHVQITVAEEEGVGTRAGYYEQAGALRDMVQNHMLQLLELVAMEPPYSLDPDVVRDEKLEVLQALRPITGETVDRQVVRAQYAGYQQESGVRAGSRTETYVALALFIDNWRWAGVPFFMRTGKCLPTRASEIAVHLKAVPPILFNANRAAPLDPNVLIIRIQPDEGFAIGISSKVPGPHVQIAPVKMDFCYQTAFGKSSPEAYERLLLDVMEGDPSLFMRRDAVETAWQWTMPILQRWQEQSGSPLPVYKQHTWGPAEADALIEATGRRWRVP